LAYQGETGTRILPNFIASYIRFHSLSKQKDKREATRISPKKDVLGNQRASKNKIPLPAVFKGLTL
jgi:hypothetical protein